VGWLSVILGLFPDELQGVRKAMETFGLWNYIQKEFQREGRADQFNKPAVKVCVYSSFFGGGVKAMRTGILEPEDAGFSTQTISGS